MLIESVRCKWIYDWFSSIFLIWFIVTISQIQVVTSNLFSLLI